MAEDTTPKGPTGYELSIARHLDICAAEVRGRTYRLPELLASAGTDLTWEEVADSIEQVTGVRVTNPTLRAWKKRQEGTS